VVFKRDFGGVGGVYDKLAHRCTLFHVDILFGRRNGNRILRFTQIVLLISKVNDNYALTHVSSRYMS
jgi:hypothetical protein